MKQQEQIRYTISVLVADRVGILRDITSAVTDMGANVDGISQTVVAGYFTVILTASFPAPKSAESIRDAILQNFRRNEAVVVVIPYDARRVARRPARGDRYVVTVAGMDRTGILEAVTTYLAEKGVNIEDWHVVFEGPAVTHIGEITVPAPLDVKQLQDEFHQLLAPLGLVSCILHENIFRATSEIGAIRTLLEEAPHA